MASSKALMEDTQRRLDFSLRHQENLEQYMEDMERKKLQDISPELYDTISAGVKKMIGAEQKHQEHLRAHLQKLSHYDQMSHIIDYASHSLMLVNFAGLLAYFTYSVSQQTISAGWLLLVAPTFGLAGFFFHMHKYAKLIKSFWGDSKRPA